MTNENFIEIKEQKKFWLIKGILLLLAMLISAFIGLSPLIPALSGNGAMMLHIVGAIGFLVFTALFAVLLYKVSKPQNALIISARGFIDRKNVGDGIEIEWTNVASVKMLGKTNVPFLGITLENSDIVLAKMKKNVAAEMRENIDNNLPNILISQHDVKITIKELKDIFSKFTREARTLESEVPKKQKSNPFSTDDVLRAFGKLPKEETKEDDIATLEVDNNVNNPFEVPDEVPVQHEQEKRATASDSFYEALRSKAFVNADQNGAVVDSTSDKETNNADKTTLDNGEIDNTEDEMTGEIQEILSRAKSSRISEIEKILNDSKADNFEDNTIEISETSTDPEDDDVKTYGSDKITEDDEIAETGVGEATDSIEKTEAIIEDDSPIEITLDTMIENALNSETREKSESEISIEASEDENLTSTIEFIQDLSDALETKTKKKKTLTLQEKNED